MSLAKSQRGILRVAQNDRDLWVNSYIIHKKQKSECTRSSVYLIA